jgi:hypothetical protein
MNAALALARSYGVAVGFADLGDWGSAELRSEYDPKGPAIRINARVAARVPVGALGEFVLLAIGHELYHHRERIGEIAVVGDRARRERAADRYARELLERTA